MSLRPAIQRAMLSTMEGRPTRHRRCPATAMLPRPNLYGAPERDLEPLPFPPDQTFVPQRNYGTVQNSPGSLARQLLAPQNAVRAGVGEQPMRWSDHLARVARRWAEHLIATGQFKHHLGDRYGENLYEMTGGTASPRQVVAAWADEARQDRSSNQLVCRCLRTLHPDRVAGHESGRLCCRQRCNPAGMDVRVRPGWKLGGVSPLLNGCCHLVLHSRSGDTNACHDE